MNEQPYCDGEVVTTGFDPHHKNCERLVEFVAWRSDGEWYVQLSPCFCKQPSSLPLINYRWVKRIARVA